MAMTDVKTGRRSIFPPIRPTSSSAVECRRVSLSCETFSELDTGPFRICEEGDLQTDRRHIAIWHLQFDAARLQLSAERFQVLHLEADMVERAAFGRRLRLAGLA